MMASRSVAQKRSKKMRWKEINRLGNEISELYEEIDARARQEVISATVNKDLDRLDEIEAEREQARKAKREALDLLTDELLTDAVVGEVVDALNSHTDRARKLVDRMKGAADALDAIKQGAELATGLLGTLKKILVA